MKDFGGILGNKNNAASVVNFPYVIMYNRFTGKMRTFIAQKNNALQDHLKIDIGVVGESLLPSLLALSDGKPVPVSTFTNKTSTALAPFEGNGGSWTYADFLMAYDPCTCLYGGSYLNFSLTGVSRQTVNLETQTEGTIVAQGDYKKPGNSYSWRDIADKYVKSFTSLGDFAKQNKEYSMLITGKDEDAKKLNDLLFNATILGAGLAGVPYVKEALKLYDLFIAAPAGPQSVTMTPMVTQTTGTITGTITGSNPYGSISFSVPGSNNSSVQDESYPHYNEALGTVSLLKRPTLFRDVQIQGYPGDIGVHRERISVRDPILYVVNPASGLYVQDALISIVDVGGSTDNFTVSQADGTLSCGNSASKTFEHDTESSVVIPNWKLSVTFNLKKHLGGENVLIHYLYDVDLVSTPGIAQFYVGCDYTFFRNAYGSEIQNFCQSPEYKVGRTIKAPKDDDPTFMLAHKDAKQNISTFSVQPNPVSEVAIINYDLKQDSKIRVYITDLSGRKMTELIERQDAKGEQNVQINTRDLPNGMYMIVLEQDGNQTAKKLIVQH